MALDGQVTYLSTESAADFQRPRTPRRSPRLRMYEEEEEQIDSGGMQSNSGMRAPIIGYEVVDQRQKFTVQWLNLLVFELKLYIGLLICVLVWFYCVLKKVIEDKTCDLTGAIRDKMLTLSKRFRILQCHCVYFLCAWLELSLIYAIYSTTVGSIAVSNEFRIAITFFFILKLWIFGNWYCSVLRKCHAWIIRGYVLVHARKEIRTLSMFLEKNYANSFKYVKTERSLNIICLDPDLSQSCWAKYFNPFFDFM